MELITYKGDKKLKTLFVNEVKWHEKNDALIKGTYGTGSNGDWKGCAVGCSIHSLNRKLGKDYKTNDHSVYEKELGIPEWLARLEDTIFEGLPEKEAKLWPAAFAEAVPVGVNLDPVKWKFCAFILKENIERVLKLDIKDELKEQVVKAIQGVLAVHENAIKTGKWDESAARSAESAARSARSAAWSAAWSAESAAESAAWSAESAYERQGNYLLKLLKAAK